MLDLVKSPASAFGHGDRYLDRLVGDFSDADWAFRDPAGHDPRWLTGHLAIYRLKITALMGLAPAPSPWEAAFVRGTSAADLPADLDPRELVAAFHAAGAAMAGAWDGLTAEALAKPFGRTLPDGSDTIAGGIGFLAWHEAYHLGQLGLLRKLAGKPGAA